MTSIALAPVRRRGGTALCSIHRQQTSDDQAGGSPSSSVAVLLRRIGFPSSRTGVLIFKHTPCVARAAILFPRALPIIPVLTSSKPQQVINKADYKTSHARHSWQQLTDSFTPLCPCSPHTNERKLREVFRGRFGHRDKNLALLWRREVDTRLGRKRLQMPRNVRHDYDGVVSAWKLTSSCYSEARSHLLSH